jgi:hypothetical protein
VAPHPAQQAIRDFWHAREEQARQLRGRVDSTSFVGIRQGTWAVVDAVIEELVGCGVPRASIRRDPRLGLPSAYLPATRHWDLLVLDDGIPVAAMDLRFQMGSAGKNLANRMGEFVSQAADLQRAYQHASVRPFKPCLGLFFVLEENEDSTRPRRWHGGSPASESETGALSYRDQYAQSFRRLLNDGMYDAVCYLTTTRPPDFSISEPYPEMGFSPFVTVLAQRIEEIKQTRRRSGLDAVSFGQLLAQRTTSTRSCPASRQPQQAYRPPNPPSSSSAGRLSPTCASLPSTRAPTRRRCRLRSASATGCSAASTSAWPSGATWSRSTSTTSRWSARTAAYSLSS